MPKQKNNITVSSKSKTNQKVKPDEISKRSITSELKKLGIEVDERVATWRFIRLLSVLLVGGILIGGLVSLYRATNITQPNMVQSDQIAFSPDEVQESTIYPPLPLVNEPGLNEGKLDYISDTKYIRNEQPEGTKEYNGGKYKVYEYPDSTLIIVKE